MVTRNNFRSELRHEGVNGMRWGYTYGKKNDKRVAGEATNKTSSETTKKKETKKSSDKKKELDLEETKKLVNEIIRGNYGNGQERIDALTKAGYDFKTIQGYVNDVLAGKEIKLKDIDSKNEKSDDEAKSKSESKSKSKKKKDDDEELKHYGVKGMKWGVRKSRKYSKKATEYESKAAKYQNKATSELAKSSSERTKGNSRKAGRHMDKASKASETARNYRSIANTYRQASNDALEDGRAKSDRQTASERRRLLSDAELKSRVDRLKMEKQLKELTEEDLSAGRKIVGDSSKKTVSTVVSGATLYAVKAGLTGSFNPVEAAAYMAPKPKNK